MSHLIYLHGFLSSPDSQKAQATKKWLSEHRPDIHYQCPFLSSYPHEALTQLHSCIDACSERPYLVGSSLGGFWSSYLIERDLAEKAVLVNPAVSPQLRFRDRLGIEQQSYYSDEVYRLDESDLDTLAKSESDSISDPERYWVMLQTADEVLDYRMALERYKGAKFLVEEGGDHSFVGYGKHLDDILTFFDI